MPKRPHRPPPPPPRVDDERFVPVSETTRCAYCEKKIRSSCIRDVRVELITELGANAGEISLRGLFFCPPVADPNTGMELLVCVRSTADTVLEEADNPANPKDPAFPEIRKKFRGQLEKYRLGYVSVGPAGEGAVPAGGPGDVHGAGYRAVTTPGFADQVIANPR